MLRFVLLNLTVSLAVLLCAALFASSASAEELQLTVEYVVFEAVQKEQTKVSRVLNALDLLNLFGDEPVVFPPRAPLASLETQQQDRLQQLRQAMKPKRQILLKKSVSVAKDFEMTDRKDGVTFHCEGDVTHTREGKLRTQLKTSWGEADGQANQAGTIMDLELGKPYAMSGIEEERTSGRTIRRTAKFIVVQIDQ